MLGSLRKLRLISHYYREKQTCKPLPLFIAEFFRLPQRKVVKDTRGFFRVDGFRGYSRHDPIVRVTVVGLVCIVKGVGGYPGKLKQTKYMVQFKAIMNTENDGRDGLEFCFKNSLRAVSRCGCLSRKQSKICSLSMLHAPCLLHDRAVPRCDRAVA